MVASSAIHQYQTFKINTGFVSFDNGMTESSNAGKKVNKYMRANMLAPKLTPASNPIATAIPSPNARYRRLQK